MKIGIDIGGSSIKAGLISKNKIIKKAKIKTPIKRKEFLEAIFYVVDELFSSKVNFIGMGCPGPLSKTGTLNTPNIPKNTNILNPLKRKYKTKVKLENDANCFALAEANKRKEKSIVCLTLGSGVGSSLLINKKLYKGRGNATELGHMTIKFDGYKDVDKIPGSVEAHCGSGALKRIAKKFNIKVKSAIEIHKLAEKNNKKAKKTFEIYGTYLGITCANIINIFDPDIIIIGGAMAGSWKFFKTNMNKEIKKRSILRPCPVTKSNIKHAGILGASLLN
jgi:glucokinase